MTSKNFESEKVGVVQCGLDGSCLSQELGYSGSKIFLE
jgi:hypothetical protein